MSDWSTNILEDVDYYKRVLIDGCVIEYRDISFCDLRFHISRLSGEEKPYLQIYKKNLKGKEFCQTYHNFEEAYESFQNLKKGCLG